MGNQPSQGPYLQTGQHKENKYAEKTMPIVGFEPVTPAAEQTKKVLASRGVTTVLSIVCIILILLGDEQGPFTLDQYSSTLILLRVVIRIVLLGGARN
jgi:hypothetical protein